MLLTFNLIALSVQLHR